MKSKYIIFEHENFEVPLVFSSLLPHDEMAGSWQVKSAGFCELNHIGQWVVSGQSESLNLRARPQDVEILMEHLGNSIL